MSKELALVILLNRSCFDKNSIRRIEHLLKSGIDWFQVFIQSVQRHTVYLTYSVLSDLHYLYLLPGEVRDLWAVSYYGNMLRNQRLIAEENLLITELQKRDIPVYPIKGIALLHSVYDNIGVRHLSDIDFLVSPQYRTAICNIMNQLQYDPLYINGTDPYLYNCHAQGYHSLFYTKKQRKSHDTDFCCEFSFSLFESEDYLQLFQYITECLSFSSSAPAFHVAHIILICMYYFKEMENRGFPKDLENENLMKLVDIHAYVSRYGGDEVRCSLKSASIRFHLEHVISYTIDHIKRFRMEDVTSWIL